MGRRISEAASRSVSGWGLAVVLQLGELSGEEIMTTTIDDSTCIVLTVGLHREPEEQDEDWIAEMHLFEESLGRVFK